MIMKKIVFISALLLSTVFLGAQTIQLPAPVKTGGKPLMEALNQRHSTREFDTTRDLSKQMISNLLWAAWGFNRENKRTAPSSMNKQEIDLYIALKDGIYLYDAKNNTLRLIVSGDYRKDAGMQPYVATAPVNIIYVCNKSRMNAKNENDLGATYTNSGFIAQNVYLFCASENLATVVRGSVNKENLGKIMHLTDDQIIILAQTIGYPKK